MFNYLQYYTPDIQPNIALYGRERSLHLDVAVPRHTLFHDESNRISGDSVQRLLHYLHKTHLL